MQIEKKTLKNVFLGVIACIVLYWVLHEVERVNAIYTTIKNILSPFFVGACLAFVLNVPMRVFEGLLKGVKSNTLRRAIAVILTIILLLLILTAVFALLIPQLGVTLNSLTPKLSAAISNLEGWLKDLMEDNPKIMEFINTKTDLESLNWASIAQKAVSVLVDSLSTVFVSAFSAIGSLYSGIMNVFIALVFSLYCLFQKEKLARQFRKLLYAFLPEKVTDEIIRIMRLANSTFSNFLSGQCIEVCILGSMFAVVMAIFRMPYIPLVSVLIAITAFIPIVGAWIGCVLGAFLILVANPMQAVWFVAMFLVLQQIENNMIYPRVVGTSIGLPGMWVLLAVAVGGELFGVVGMFLMIPVVSVLFTLLREVTYKRLHTRDIDPDKLKEQPPELSSKIKVKIKDKKDRKAKKSSKQKKTKE